MLTRLNFIVCIFFSTNLSLAGNFQWIQQVNNTVRMMTRTYAFKGKTVTLIGLHHIGPRAYYDQINAKLLGEPVVHVSDLSWPNIKPIKAKINSLTPEQRRGLACVLKGERFRMAHKYQITTALEMLDFDLASDQLCFATYADDMLMKNDQFFTDFDGWLEANIHEDLALTMPNRPMSLSEKIDFLSTTKSASLPSFAQFLALMQTKASISAIRHAEKAQPEAKILAELIYFVMNEKNKVVALQTPDSMPLLEKELVNYGLLLTKEDAWIDFATLPPAKDLKIIGKKGAIKDNLKAYQF